MDSLSPVAMQFILHWGEMSNRWGINRSMAQIHALLYLSPEPLDAEEIARTLSLARSNVSTSLRELQAWGIVRVVHLLGDRRDHFETMKDAWQMLLVILEQRRRREIEPTIAMLRECMAKSGDADSEEPYPRKKMLELLDLLETLTAWYEQLPRPVQREVLKMGGKIQKFTRSFSTNRAAKRPS
jgi:DNA-binding transcriptional regulator GbsR (MarR family)